MIVHWKSYLPDLWKRLNNDEYMPCSNLREIARGEKPLRVVLREKENRIFKRSTYTYTSTGSSLRDVLALADGSGPTSSLINDDALFTDVQGLQDGYQSSISARVTPSYIKDSVVSFNTFSSESAVLQTFKFKEIAKLDSIIKELQSQWCINTTHELWKRIANATTKYEVCFITGVVVAETSADISCERRASGGFRALLSELGTVFRSYWDERLPSLEIFQGAVLAYKVQKIEVNATNGRIGVPLGTMSRSGDFKRTVLNIDPDDEIDNCRMYYSKYLRQLSYKKQTDLRKALKELLPTACATAIEITDASQDFVQRNETSKGVDCSYNRVTNDPQLELLMKMAMDALPTIGSPKEKEISDLMLKLGVPGLLDLPKERDAVYGIRYFVTALCCLPPEALSWLRKCADDGEEGKALQTVTELERLLSCVIEWNDYNVGEISPEVQTFLSLSLLDDEESFTYAWRAAYVSAIYLCGLPVSSASP